MEGTLMKRPADYESRIGEIQNELKSKTIGEVEEDRGITKLDYTGVGYGYNLKSHYPKTINEAIRDVSVSDFKL
jgi:hypothetical protein